MGRRMAEELFPIKYNDAGEPSVSARDLYAELEVTDRFSRWFERMAAYGFDENIDFTSVKSSTLVNNGAERELQDYDLTVDMAKHICMVQKTEKSKRVRQYLIDLEKAWNTPEQVMARALKIANKAIEDLKAKITEQKPLVDFAVHVSQSKDTIDMNEMAKIAKDENIDIGRNRLIAWLKEKKILLSNNTPYQSYIERGYFDVVEVKKDTSYGTRVFPKTVITGKGQIWIIEKLRSEYQNEESEEK